MITVPTEFQREVLMAPEEASLVLPGSRGGGKTSAAMLLIARAMEKYPGSKHLYARPHLKSLGETEDEFAGLIANIYGHRGARVNRSDHEITLLSGSKVSFAPLADNNDLLKLQGLSFDTETFDEFGTYTGHQVRYVANLRANLRGNPGCPRRQILLMNPGGANHVTCVRSYISKLAPNAITRLGAVDWLLLNSVYSQNPHLPADYLDNLKAAAHGDAALFKAWAEGAWNIARGAILGDVIDEAKQMLASGSRELVNLVADSQSYCFASTDWGQSSPSVSYLCARLLAPIARFPRNSLILIDEVSSADPDDLSVGMNWSAGRLADEINAMFDRWQVRNRWGVIDDARGLGDDTLIKTMQSYNLHFTKPLKGRAANLAIMRELLFNSHANNQRPGMWISDRCQDWWATVPLLPRDPHRPELPNSAANDHAYDASSYAASHEPRIIRYRANTGF